MTVIEELLEAFKAQQQTIETLTVKLEETTAELEKANARIAELEEQLHKDSHKELFTNGIEAKPYDFKAEDEVFRVLPETENGYNKSAVKEYYKNIKTMAAERWNGE